MVLLKSFTSILVGTVLLAVPAVATAQNAPINPDWETIEIGSETPINNDASKAVYTYIGKRPFQTDAFRLVSRDNAGFAPEAEYANFIPKYKKGVSRFEQGVPIAQELISRGGVPVHFFGEDMVFDGSSLKSKL